MEILWIVLFSIAIVIAFVVGIVVSLGLLCYFLIFPYYLAKHFPITKNLLVDCIFAYCLTWTFTIFGNCLHLLINYVVNQNKQV